jgi:hypothetical protein
MANPSNSGSKVPGKLVERSVGDWHQFTGAVVKGCVGVAVLLVLMLVFLRIL